VSVTISTRIDSDNRVAFEILIDGRSLRDDCVVHGVEVVREVNRIPQATVTIIDGGPSTGRFQLSARDEFVPGREVEIKAGYRGQKQRIFSGIVIRHGVKVRGSGSSFMVLTCADRAIRMTVGRSTRQFVRKTDAEAIAQLVHDYGLTPEVEATPTRHELAMKHDASDWDYVLARAEANGRIVVVADGTLSVSAPRPGSAPAVAVRFGDAVVALDAELDAAHQVPEVIGRAWDPSGQAIVTGRSREPQSNRQGNLAGRDLGEALGLAALQTRSIAPVAAGDLASWADAALARARLARIRGKVSFPGHAAPLPGGLVELSGLGPRFEGAAFVAGVTHLLEAGQWTTTVRFGLEPTRPVDELFGIEQVAAAGLRPGVRGLQIAKVKQVHGDPAGQHRVKVVLPLVDKGEDGVWVRVASPYAGTGIGIAFHPEIGDEVVLGFLDDDPVAPVLLGSLNSSARARPLAGEEGNRLKTIVTRSRLKLTFDEDDKAIRIETPGGHSLEMKDAGETVTLVDSTGNRLHMGSAGITLETPADLVVKAGGSISLSAAASIDVKADADLAIKAMNAAISADASLTAKGASSAEFSAGGQTTVKGAVVLIN